MNNAEIQEKAKQYMKGNYGTALLMGLIIMGISIVCQIVLFGGGVALGLVDMENMSASMDAINSSSILNLFWFIVQVGIMMLSYGYARSFLELAKSKYLSLEYLFSYFNSKGCKLMAMEVVKGMLIALGMILFILPGIYLALAYSMTTFAMMEHPEFGIMECLRASRRRMKNQKQQLFMLMMRYLLPVIVFMIVASILMSILNREGYVIFALILLLFALAFAFIWYGIYIIPNMNTAVAIFYKDKINPDMYD